MTRRSREPAREPEATPRFDNPFRDLLDFATLALGQVQGLVKDDRLRRELKVLGDTAIDAADRTGHTIEAVEARIRALEDKLGAAVEGELPALDKNSAEWKQVERVAASFDDRSDRACAQHKHSPMAPATSNQPVEETEPQPDDKVPRIQWRYVAKLP